MINWTGDTTHPGFVNLLTRVVELMPPPITPVERITGFLARNRGVILTSAIAVLAFLLLFRMSSLLDTQIEKQAQIASEINRTLQPIKDLSMSAFVDFDSAIPGMQDYQRLLAARLLITRDGVPQLRPLPFGVIAVRGSPQGIEQVGILRESGLWPRKDDPSLLFYVLDGVEMSLEFRADSANAASSASPDLQMQVGANDPDGSEGARASPPELQWEFKTGKLSRYFTDTPAPKGWKSNDRIVSVPDLEKSTLTITFLSISGPDAGDENVSRALTTRRAGMRLSDIFLSYSGRKIHIRGKDLKEGVDGRGLHRYTIRLDSKAVERV